MSDLSQINGVTYTSLKQIGDERGTVLHMLRNDAVDFTNFGECYFSEIFPGAVKAWKCHKLQTQFLSVPVGRVRFVLFDGRDNSSTKNKMEISEIGRPENYCRLKIPPGIWYGFTCISSSNALVVNCADIPFDESERLSKDSDDPAFPFKW